jgi:[ribosomal protein S5]-alanine N-acetyltransferase
MSFLRPFSFADVLPPIQGRQVELRAPEMRDFDAWADLRSTSREFLRPWEPTWPPNDLARVAFRARLKRYSQDVRSDAAYPFFIFRQSDGALVGGLTLGQIRRGVAQTASLGYWMGQVHAGQGYMSDAVRAVLPYAFNGLRLRRIEAACLPENEPSIRLLERVGFIREGYARSYLCIAGAWRDHLLYAILMDDQIR